MRITRFLLLGIACMSPAIVQAQLAMPVTTQQVAGDKGAKPLTANGKIQIGYEKRADYPTIKQGAAAKAAAATTAANGAAPTNTNRVNLDGNILPPGVSGIPSPSFNRSQPGANPNNALPAQAQAAAAKKPRGDSALKGDSASFNAAPAANATSQSPNAQRPNVNMPINANGINTSGNRNNAGIPNGFPTNGIPGNPSFNNGNGNTNGNNNNTNGNGNPFGGAGFVIVNGRAVRQ